MSDIQFAGGTAHIGQCGSRNPVAAMMAQEICKQINAGSQALSVSATNEISGPASAQGKMDKGGVGRA